MSLRPETPQQTFLFSLPAVESAAVTTRGFSAAPLSGLVVETTASDEFPLKLGCSTFGFIGEVGSVNSLVAVDILHNLRYQRHNHRQGRHSLGMVCFLLCESFATAAAIVEGWKSVPLSLGLACVSRVCLARSLAPKQLAARRTSGEVSFRYFTFFQLIFKDIISLL